MKYIILLIALVPYVAYGYLSPIGGSGGGSFNGQLTQGGTDVSVSNPLPVSGSITATNPSVSTSNAAAPASSTLVGGSDGTNLRPFKVSSLGVISVDGSAVTQPVSAASLPLPSGAATSANQTTSNSSLSSIDTKLTSQATAVLQTSGNASLTSIDSKILVGQVAAAASQSVTLSNENVQDLYVVGQAAQTAVVNNILTTTAGAAATDLTGYRSGVVQVVSTATSGQIIFESSNDNVNFNTMPVYNQLTITGTPVTSTITTTANQNTYVFPITGRYIRLRINSVIAGGSVQAYSKFSQVPWSPAVMQVAQNIGSNLNATVSGIVSMTSPSNTSDVASTAITTSATVGPITPANGATQLYQILVTAASGTNPTMDVQVQESADAGTNWFPVYDFPRITTTGAYASPLMPMTGNRLRYVQTIGGTGPSFTRSINRVQGSANTTIVRQQYDRTISLTTLSSTTPSLLVDACKNVKLSINIGTTTIAPVLQLQESEDGTNFTNIGTPLTAVASSTVTYTLNNVSMKFVRAIVTTAGTSTVAGFVLLKGF